MEKHSHFHHDLANLPGLAHNFRSRKGNDFIQYKETENDLHLKIMKTRAMILGQFPELANRIEDLPQELLTEQNKESKINRLRSYYETLRSLFSKYTLEYYLDQNTKIYKTSKHAT